VTGPRRLATPLGFDRPDLERFGFVGFVPVATLREMRPMAAVIPNDAVGVYLAYRAATQPVSFRRANPAGTWAGDPTLPIAHLRARWVAGSRVVYIGKAARPSPSSRNSLRSRIRTYIRFGAGSNARHRGGYPTWQLADSDRLLIAWLVVDAPETAERVEGRLIGAHVRRYGALPFANSVAPFEDA
jgi:hypothetical protein